MLSRTTTFLSSIVALAAFSACSSSPYSDVYSFKKNSFKAPETKKTVVAPAAPTVDPLQAAPGAPLGDPATAIPGVPGAAPAAIPGLEAPGAAPAPAPAPGAAPIPGL